MAIHGRSFPLRPVTIIRGVVPFDAPAISLGAFTTTSSFPALTVTVPDANVTLGTFTTTSSFPSLSVSAGFSTTLGLGAFVTTSIFPRLYVDVPLIPGARMTGADGEIQWIDDLWSPTGIYRPADDLEGWDDLPPQTSGDEPKPNQHGAWPGVSYAESRIVTVTVQLRDDSPTWRDSVRALRRATRIPVDETDYPLVIATRDETLLAWARVRNRGWPQGLIGVGAVDVPVQFVCADPRRYYPDEYEVSIAAGQTVGIANDGDAPTSPLLVFAGPVTVPRVTTDSQSLAFNVILGVGETLTVDTRLGTAEWSTGDFAPTDDFSVPIELFQVGADGQDVTYDPDSGGGNGMTFTWRYATW